MENNQKLENYFNQNKGSLETDITQLKEGLSKNLDKKTYTELYEKTNWNLSALKIKLDKVDWDLKDGNHLEDKIVLASWNSIKAKFETMKKSFDQLKNPNQLKDKKEIAQINNWPKSALFDIKVSVKDIRAIKPVELVAQNGLVEYYTVDVPSEGRMVLRINKKDEWDEVALLNVKELKTNEEIINEIESAEYSASWNTFKDVEMDWHNAWTSNWQTLKEGYSSLQAAWTWIAVWAWTYLGIWKVATMTVYSWFWKAVVTGVAKWATWLGWATIWAWSLTVWAVAATAVATWVIIWAWTDVDLTTKRANDIWLTAKLDAIRREYI